MELEKEQIILVTPVWNDASRLARFGPELASALASRDWPVSWIIADDGSSLAEQQRLGELLSAFKSVYPAVTILRQEERSRKGGVIRQAWDTHPEALWLAFVDADGAISAEELMSLLEKAIDQGSKTVVAAIRRNSSSSPVERPFFRALSFRVFVMITRWLLKVPFQDSQCGAKIVPGAAYRSLSDKLMERGFTFDAELLLALRENGYAIEEVPVAWKEKEGGKIHPLRDAWGMLAALLRIRKRARLGWYRE